MCVSLVLYDDHLTNTSQNKKKQNKTESNKKAQTTKDNHQLSPEKNHTDAFEWSKYY